MILLMKLVSFLKNKKSINFWVKIFVKALRDEGFVRLYAVRSRNIRLKKMKIQLCTIVRLYAQWFDSQSLWDLPKLWRMKVLYACTLYAPEKLCPKKWKFNFVRLYDCMINNLTDSLFEIYQSFEGWRFCTLVRSRKVMPQKMKIQLCTLVRLYDQ